MLFANDDKYTTDDVCVCLCYMTSHIMLCISSRCIFRRKIFQIRHVCVCVCVSKGVQLNSIIFVKGVLTFHLLMFPTIYLRII